MSTLHFCMIKFTVCYSGILQAITMWHTVKKNPTNKVYFDSADL